MLVYVFDSLSSFFLSTTVLFVFTVLGLLPYKMPRFYKDPAIEGDSSSEAEADQDASKTNTSATRVRYWIPLLFLTFFYYFISCGIERIYQPMVRAI